MSHTPTASPSESLFYTPQSRSGVTSVQLPPVADRGNPDTWLAVLEDLLPPDAERGSQDDKGDALKIATELSTLLFQAREEGGHDILSYLGLAKGRWDDAARIINAISGANKGNERLSVIDHLGTGIQWPQSTLDAMTYERFKVDKDKTKSSPYVGPKIEEVAGNGSDPIWLRKCMCSRGLGQIWRSLGNLILTAASRPTDESRKVMQHVLAALATLHHDGVISPAVYTFVATDDAVALHQPPTLHLLSSRILEAMSDAAWYVHAAAIKAQQNASGTQPPLYVVDRYRFLVDELGHEVWLELVLWSCLHGDWISDGAAVLEQMAESSDWSLLSWKHVTASVAGGTLPSSADWSSLIAVMYQKMSKPRPEDRRRVERTVSSEVVSAYVDGLTNVIRTSIPERGMPIRKVLSHVQGLKALLDRHNMGLGYTTWDAVCVRFIESGGFEVEQDPRLLLNILEITQPFGRELASDNLKPTVTDSFTSIPSYVFDASAAAVGLLHRAIDTYISLSDVEGALRAFKSLQTYTDLNKQRSLEAFFEDLKKAGSRKALLTGSIFSGNLSAAEYPAFHPQIPTTVLANLLEMLAEARMFQLGDWMIYTDEVDGRIIPLEMYADPTMAAALIRYATVNGDKALLSNVVQAQASLGKQGLSLPTTFLNALLQSQIKDRHWESAENILNFLAQSKTQSWHPRVICDLAHEILVLQRGVIIQQQSSDPQALAHATTIFRSLLRMRYGPPMHAENYDGFTVVHCIIGVLSSVSKEWAGFAAPLSPRQGSMPLLLHIRMFDALLDGVVAAFGVETGKELWEKWCAKVERRATQFADISPRAPSIADNYFDQDARVVLADLPVGVWTFRNRIKPQLSTIRVMLRAILEERGSFDTDTLTDTDERSGILGWALGVLRTMTATPEEMDRELERLVTARKWQARSGKGECGCNGNPEGNRS